MRIASQIVYMVQMDRRLFFFWTVKTQDYVHLSYKKNGFFSYMDTMVNVDNEV